MKIKDILLMAVSKVETTDFVDDVKVALADSGRIDLSKLQWTREPKAFEVKGDTIAITTAPHTDLWQRTYYHFQNDNAPVLQMKTKEKFFSFVERVCGIRERRVPALRQRGYKQGLFRLGYHSHPRRCQDNVVSFLAP